DASTLDSDVGMRQRPSSTRLSSMAPRLLRVNKAEDDLSNELVGRKETQRLLVVLEWKHPIDHRMQSMGPDKRVHLPKIRTRSDKDTLRLRYVPQQQARGNLSIVAREATDDGQCPTWGKAAHGLGQRTFTS